MCGAERVGHLVHAITIDKRFSNLKTKTLEIYIMAEGGDFGYENPALDHDIDHDDDDDEEELNRTRPFQPTAASTPYHGGEQIEMQTMQHEQTGLPETSYAEEAPDAPLFGEMTAEDRPVLVENAKDFIKKLYPRARIDKLGPMTFNEKGEFVIKGPKGGENRVFKVEDFRHGVGRNSQLLKSFETKYLFELGPRAQEIIEEDCETIQERRRRTTEAEKQLVTEREKKEQEIQDLKPKEAKAQERIDKLQEEHGSNLEVQSEFRRQKQRKKNYQNEIKNKEKELNALEKQVKNKQKQKATQEKAKLDEMISK